MASCLEILFQLIQALLAAPHQGTRGPHPKDFTKHEGGHTGIPHGHAPLRSNRSCPGQASEAIVPITPAGVVCGRLLRDSQRTVRKALDEASRVDHTLAGVLPKPEKSQYVRPEGVTEKAAIFATTGTTLKHEAGARNLGGHTGYQKTCDAWIKTQLTDWAMEFPKKGEEQ